MRDAKCFTDAKKLQSPPIFITSTFAAKPLVRLRPYIYALADGEREREIDEVIA